MINSKEDYLFYLASDKKALEIPQKSIRIFIQQIFLPNYIWRFQKLLRKTEYYKNVKNKHLFNKLIFVLLTIKFRRLSLKLGFSIPLNIFGPGLAIVHYGTIIVNANAKVGANCRLHACTNIGASGGLAKAPKLGDNVYIAPGAKLFGDISIPNNTAIGANAVVNKSFFEESTLLAGIPAQVVNKIDIKKLIKHI
jgi:serine O-acetyltransferase